MKSESYITSQKCFFCLELNLRMCLMTKKASFEKIKKEGLKFHDYYISEIEPAPRHIRKKNIK